MKSTRLLILLMTLLSTTATFSQEKRKNIFADPQNLKVLPADITPEELSNTMKGFAMGLGVRCETCHVGEPNTPLTTFDFASDEKAMKKKARVMFSMLNDINKSYVPKLNAIENQPRVEVRCVTCHRGQQQPKLIEDVLDEQLASNGVAPAIENYNMLREELYGSHSYDFSEYTLAMYAEGLMAKENFEAAIALAKTNSEYFPESYYTYFVLGGAYEQSGQIENAINSYTRASELNPRAKEFLSGKISSLKSDSE